MEAKVQAAESKAMCVIECGHPECDCRVEFPLDVFQLPCDHSKDKKPTKSASNLSEKTLSASSQVENEQLVDSSPGTKEKIMKLMQKTFQKDLESFKSLSMNKNAAAVETCLEHEEANWKPCVSSEGYPPDTSSLNEDCSFQPSEGGFLHRVLARSRAFREGLNIASNLRTEPTDRADESAADFASNETFSESKSKSRTDFFKFKFVPTPSEAGSTGNNELDMSHTESKDSRIGDVNSSGTADAEDSVTEAVECETSRPGNHVGFDHRPIPHDLLKNGGVNISTQQSDGNQQSDAGEDSPSHQVPEGGTALQSARTSASRTIDYFDLQSQEFRHDLEKLQFLEWSKENEKTLNKFIWVMIAAVLTYCTGLKTSESITLFAVLSILIWTTGVPLRTITVIQNRVQIRCLSGASVVVSITIFLTLFSIIYPWTALLFPERHPLYYKAHGHHVDMPAYEYRNVTTVECEQACDEDLECLAYVFGRGLRPSHTCQLISAESAMRECAFSSRPQRGSVVAVKHDSPLHLRSGGGKIFYLTDEVEVDKLCTHCSRICSRWYRIATTNYEVAEEIWNSVNVRDLPLLMEHHETAVSKRMLSDEENKCLPPRTVVNLHTINQKGYHALRLSDNKIKVRAVCQAMLPPDLPFNNHTEHIAVPASGEQNVVQAMRALWKTLDYPLVAGYRGAFHNLLDLAQQTTRILI